LLIPNDFFDVFLGRKYLKLTVQLSHDETGNSPSLNFHRRLSAKLSGEAEAVPLQVRPHEFTTGNLGCLRQAPSLLTRIVT
jgi:hypothetical protein